MPMGNHNLQLGGASTRHHSAYDLVITGAGAYLIANCADLPRALALATGFTGQAAGCIFIIKKLSPLHTRHNNKQYPVYMYHYFTTF